MGAGWRQIERAFLSATREQAGCHDHAQHHDGPLPHDRLRNAVPGRDPACVCGCMDLLAEPWQYSIAPSGIRPEVFKIPDVRFQMDTVTFDLRRFS